MAAGWGRCGVPDAGKTRATTDSITVPGGNHGTMIEGASEYGIDVDVSGGAVDRLLSVGPEDVDPAPALSFCRNVFVPLTTACRYTCTYCTYFDPPGEATLMSPREVREVVRTGVEAGCTEALFTFGDDPDDRYAEIHDQLAAWGHDSVHSYLRDACEIALDAGLLPHANPGDQTRAQMQQVAETLDLTSLTVLEYPDGGLAEQNPLRLEEEVADRFHSIRPDVAITFPDHGITRHSDHLTIHHAVKRVACGLRAEGNNHPRRLAFVTFPPPSGDLAPPDDLQHSPPERIDCVVPVCTSELEQGRKALEHYVTYQPDDHRPLKFFADGIPFEIFGESHDPPLLSLLESLPRDTAGFLRPESCRQ